MLCTMASILILLNNGYKKIPIESVNDPKQI